MLKKNKWGFENIENKDDHYFNAVQKLLIKRVKRPIKGPREI
jgi:hypothetical protein